MKRVSSTATRFYKKGFPALWFGFLGLFLTLAITQGAVTNGSMMFLLVPCVMAVFGYFIMKKFVWDLVDEVVDGGDFLVIRNRGRKYQVPLTDIMNVSSTMAVNPPRITLRLDGASAAGPLGSEVSFSPEKPFTLNPFAKNAVAEDLIVRVDRARSRRAV
jgi:hypothetical protein